MSGLSRLFGLALAVASVSWLIFLSWALYTPTSEGLGMLVRVGMPTALLGTLIGAGGVGLGAWIAGFGHGVHHGRSQRD